MLLNEIVTDIETDLETGVNTHKFNAGESAEQCPLGVKTISIPLTHEENHLFNNRYGIIAASAGRNMLNHELDKLKKAVHPPESIDCFYAFTFNRNTQTPDEERAYKGRLAALKGRHTGEVMSQEPGHDLKAVLDSSVDRILNKAYEVGKTSVTRKKGSLDAKYSDMYKQFILPYTKDSNFRSNTIVVPLSSTSTLVTDFANALADGFEAGKGDKVGSVLNAFVKNTWPFFSRHNDATKEQIALGADKSVLRVPDAYINQLVKARDKISDATIKHLLDEIHLYATNEDSELVKEIKNKLRLTIHDYIVNNANNINRVSHEIVEFRRQAPSYNEFKSASKYKSLRKELEHYVALSKEIPLPSFNIIHNYSNVEKQLKYIANYMNAQDSVASEIDAIVSNLSGQDDLKIMATLDSKGASFAQAVTMLLNQVIEKPFHIHDFGLNPDAANGKAFKSFMVLHDAVYDELDGKNIILVDDNIDTGKTVQDAIKSIYLAGISPNRIVLFAPHYLTSAGEKPDAETTKEIKAARAAASARERKSAPEKSRDASVVRKALDSFKQFAGLRDTEHKGTQRIRDKFVK